MQFGKRREHDQEYTIFVASQAAMKRCLTDHQGPGQETARAIIRWSESIANRGNKLRLQWVPGHAEIEGNEVADRMAKAAAAGECHGDSESRRLLSRTSMAYLKRQATEANSRGTKEWIEERTKQRRSYTPPRNQGSARNSRTRERQLHQGTTSC